MTAQLFEFSEREVIDLLMADLVKRKQLEPMDCVSSMSAERLHWFKTKGFKIILRVEPSDPS